MDGGWGVMGMGHFERTQLSWTVPCEKQKGQFPYGQGEEGQALLGLLGAVTFLSLRILEQKGLCGEKTYGNEVQGPGWCCIKMLNNHISQDDPHD